MVLFLLQLEFKTLYLFKVIWTLVQLWDNSIERDLNLDLVSCPFYNFEYL